MKLQKVTSCCANCGKESEQTVILGVSSFGEPDLDLRPAPQERQALKYQVQECPHCHYCNYDIEEKTAGIVFSEEYNTVLSNSCLEEIPKRFYLMGILARDNADYMSAGQSFLNAAWYYDDISDAQKAKEARVLAAENLSKHVLKNNDGNAGIVLLDIFRRIGEKSEALGLINWLSAIDDEEAHMIIDFQKALLEKGDEKVHDLGEVFDD